MALERTKHVNADRAQVGAAVARLLREIKRT
jgi:hypothetical protein